jgi:hypothetical protein
VQQTAYRLSSRRILSILSCLGHCEVQYIEQILGTFAKLRKAGISFVVSVRLYARLAARKQQHDSNWADFQEI